VKHCGIVSGSTVRTRNVANDVFMSVKAMVGGELPHYTELLRDSREEALFRLREVSFVGKF
jgi:uncharacterized protein YbjQ (UPF0145 family)